MIKTVTLHRFGYIRLQMMCTLPSVVALRSSLVMIPLGRWVQIICRSRPLSLLTQSYSLGTDIICSCVKACEKTVSVAGS
jgi:hypothetical protein